MNLLLKSTSFFILLIWLLASSSPVLAKENVLSSEPITLYADKIEYFGEEGQQTIIATGNIIATQDNQEVSAGFAEYNVNKDILIAKDNVKILEKQGYVINADKIILSDRLRFGSLSYFTILTPDKSTLRGESAKKENEIITDVKKGYYTACKICPGKSPIWEFTATSATLDEEEDKMTYYNPVLKYYGTPAFYSPYLSHYTSKAKRRSGFLRPSFGNSTYLGSMIKIPYYFNLAPNYDATLKVISTSKRGVILDGEQRYLTSSGEIDSTGSITSAKHYDQPSNQAPLSPSVRYHFKSNADLDLQDNHYVGWKMKFTSDKSYLRDYNYGQEDFLTSRIYNSAYQESGFYEVQALSFQNLRPGSDNKIHQTPIVLPLFESKHNVHKFQDNSFLNFESNILKTNRYVGAETDRLSVKNTWNKPFTTNNGNNFNFFTSLRNDFYRYQNAPPTDNSSQTSTRYVSRSIPEAGVAWSYPLGNYINNTKVVVEPLASAIVTPYTDYNKKIYNEDSSSNELNDGNLFSESRYTGIDLVENTPRVSYGLKTSAYYKEWLDSNFLFGQIYRNKPYDYLSNTKEDRFSDYVGRLKFDIAHRVILSYQFKLDKYNFANKNNELNLRLQKDKVYIATELFYSKDDKIINGVKNRREYSVETGIVDYNNISFAIRGKKNISSKADNPTLENGFVSMGTNVKYTNDCITYSASMDKDLTRSDEKKTNTTYWFEISLKNIGESNTKYNR